MSKENNDVFVYSSKIDVTYTDKVCVDSYDIPLYDGTTFRVNGTDIENSCNRYINGDMSEVVTDPKLLKHSDRIVKIWKIGNTIIHVKPMSDKEPLKVHMVKTVIATNNMVFCGGGGGSFTQSVKK